MAKNAEALMGFTLWIVARPGMSVEAEEAFACRLAVSRRPIKST